MTTQTSSLDTSGGNISTWLRFTLVFLIVAGLVYPLVTTASGGHPLSAAGAGQSD